MSIIPEYDNSNFLRALAMHKDFLPDEGVKAVALGYFLFRESDGAVWGTGDSKAFYLFIKQDVAERAARSLGKNWSVKEVACIETRHLKKRNG